MTTPDNAGELLFEEAQDPPWPWLALALGAPGISVLAAGRLAGLPERLGAAALTAGLLAWLARQFLLPMRTAVTPDAVIVVFGRRTRFRIPVSDITQAYPRVY